MATKAVRRRRTTAANPSKRKRKPAKRKSARKRKSTRRKRRNPSTSLARRRSYKAPAKRRKRRNPSSSSGLVLAGVPVIETAAGAAATIAVSQIVDNMPWAVSFKAKNPKAGALLGPAVAGAAGWALTKYVKNPMAKKTGTAMVQFAIFKAVDGVAGAQIKEMVKNIGKPSAAAGATGGVYFAADDTGGIYTDAEGGDVYGSHEGF